MVTDVYLLRLQWAGIKTQHPAHVNHQNAHVPGVDVLALGDKLRSKFWGKIDDWPKASVFDDLG